MSSAISPVTGDRLAATDDRRWLRSRACVRRRGRVVVAPFGRIPPLLSSSDRSAYLMPVSDLVI